MKQSPTKIYQQAIVVLGGGATPENDRLAAQQKSAAKVSSSSLPAEAINVSSTTSRISFSTLPIVSEAQLLREYSDLGNALSQLAPPEQTDDWGIERAVHDAALRVAAGLMAESYPAPRIFTHGPGSVVFNWSYGTDNLYLTISADRISALISSPERIKQRVELAPSEFLNLAVILRAIKSPRGLKLITGAVSDPMEWVGE